MQKIILCLSVCALLVAVGFLWFVLNLDDGQNINSKRIDTSGFAVWEIIK